MRIGTGLRILRAMLLVLVTGWAAWGAVPARAQPACNPGALVWACFGVFELRFQGPQGAGLVRITHFANGDTLAETTGPDGRLKRLLTVAPSGLSLASGLVGDETLKPGGRNPFMFLDLAFAYPALALQAAYAAGPASVPATPVDTAVMVDGKTPVGVRAERRTDGEVAFNLKPAPPGNSRDIAGRWASRQPEPWPDDMAMDAWQQADDGRFQTLGAVRAASRSRQAR